MRALLAHAELDGLNLANRSLSEADFSGASFVGATLYGSNLERASLYCADLRGANLQSANLTRADLRGASLRGANLSFAVLDHADLRAAMMMYVGPSDVEVLDRSNPRDETDANRKAGTPTGVDFRNCSLKGVSFGNAKLDRADFSGAILEGAKFKGARLTGVVFKGAVLCGVDLKDLALPPAAFEGCLTDSTPDARARRNTLKALLDGHQTWMSSTGREGAQAVLDGEDLRPLKDLFVGRSLSGLSARNAIAVGVDFSGSQLHAAKFDGADLRDADFTGADLRGASFRGAKLAHARFDKANLCALELVSGRTIAPDLTDAEAAHTQFLAAKLDRKPADLGLRSDTWRV